MMIKLIVDRDVPEISRIWEQHHANDFSLPSRKNVVIEAKVVEGDKLIAYGMVRKVAEPIFVLDLDARQREKTKALELLMIEAYRGCEAHKLTRLFSFIRDPNFADLVVKRFGFERADLGEFLIKEL